MDPVITVAVDRHHGPANYPYGRGRAHLTPIVDSSGRRSFTDVLGGSVEGLQHRNTGRDSMFEQSTTSDVHSTQEWLDHVIHAGRDLRRSRDQDGQYVRK